MNARLLLVSLRATVLILLINFVSAASAFAAPATFAEMLAAKRDVWGEAAMALPNGASYEFFAPLLPPPRYVHADFRHYPLVLSAPSAKTKARLISNGSGVNLHGGSRSWKEVGTPVVFRVGPDEFRFGDLRARVSDPKPAEGWLPIYEITYRHGYPVQAEGLVPINQKPVQRAQEVYRLEAFASTDTRLAENAVVFVKFNLAAGSNGIVTVQFDLAGGAKFSAGKISDEHGKVVAWLDRSWKWARNGAHAPLKPGTSATLAIATKPLEKADGFKFSAVTYAEHRATTVKTWTEILSRGMNVEVPEPLVNNAWRNLLAQNFGLLNGDKIFYSAGNQYEQLYEAEGSDAALTVMDWGHEDAARRMFVPLLDFTRKGLEGHQAGLKLNDIVRYYWHTRDTGWLKENRPRWEKELRRILDTRTNEFGLLPKERYCGDISTPVFSLSVQAKAWRMLHDLPPVLRALGDDGLAKETDTAAKEFRVQLDDALAKSIRREVTPPFIPIALLADETLHSPIPATRIGSYWNLINGYVIAARLFPPGSDEDAWLPHYLEQHGGLCMGMIRSGGGEHGFWTGSDRVNPLYGTRYALDTLRRDEPERALVSFYGMLAQGFTRNTFVGGEGCTLAPVDDGGRFFYCPPNSAANAHLLAILRHLLVQDFDLDGDGEPETLRLLFGTSRRWLEDGKKITVERAPTVFGPVSVRVESHLKQGEVVAQVDLPTRNVPKKTLLRLRVPDGWQLTSAKTGGHSLALDASGALDLTGLKGSVAVRCTVRKQ